MAAALMTNDNLFELTSQISMNSLTPLMAIAPSPMVTMWLVSPLSDEI